MRKLTHEEIAKQRIPPENALAMERFPILGMLDNIRSMYNVGSMFRTSDGALIRKLYLCGYTPAPPGKEIDKTALGSVETVPWEHFPNPMNAVEAVRSGGAKLCVLEQTTRSRPYHSIEKADFPICLVIGNEITGVSADVIAAADMAIEIPMYGAKQSLNAAVAYGIALFELVRIFKA